MLFSGYFRQILPKGSREMIVHMCMKPLVIFSDLQMLNLTENMRLKALKADVNADSAALQYAEYLLRVSEGQEKFDDDLNIDHSLSINVVQSSSQLIDGVFGDLSVKHSDRQWLTSRATMTTKNLMQKSLNDEVINRFPGYP